MEKNLDEVAMLVAQAGPLNGQRWPLRRNIVIGREASCDIVIADRQVSRQHARFHVTFDGITLEDLSSKNGTHLNGRVVRDKIILQDGDVIQIALAQKFVFLSSDATVPLEAQEPEAAFAQADIPQAVPEPGRLYLEKRSRRVWIKAEGSKDPQGVEILPPLSASQFRLLEMLYENQGRVVSRNDLVATVWGELHAYEVSEQALDALVRRLRDRISSIDRTHVYVVTVRGHGLRLDNPPI